jgi:sugar lactone lactonase YvrE
MHNLRTTFCRLVLCIALLPPAALAHPGSGILVDRLGQIFFIDTGSGLWKIDSRGAVSHLSPLRNHWLAMDPDNRFTQSRVPTDPGHDWVITSAGSNPTMLISTDFPLVIGQDGNLYYPSARETNVRILRTSSTGAPSTFVTLPRSVAGAALGWVNGLTTVQNNSIYYTEDNAIRRIDARGRVTTIATVAPLVGGPAIPDVDKHPYLRGLKVSPTGVVYVADSGDARVLKITPDGKVATLVQLESPWAPTDVAIFGDIVYVLEYLHTPGDDRLEWMPRVRKIAADGKSTIIMTVDQMPGARVTKQVGAVSQDSLWEEIFDLWLRSYFVFSSRSV